MTLLTMCFNIPKLATKNAIAGDWKYSFAVLRHCEKSKHFTTYQLLFIHCEPRRNNTRKTPPQSSSTTQIWNGEGQEQESSLKLQEGDIHQDLYKLSARANAIQRAETFSHTKR